MTLWHRVQEKLVWLLGTDMDVVRRVEKFDQKQREIGHDLRNVQTKIEPLRRLVEKMREDDPDDDDVDRRRH